MGLFLLGYGTLSSESLNQYTLLVLAIPEKRAVVESLPLTSEFPMHIKGSPRPWI